MNPFLLPEQELKRRALSWALRLKVNPRLVSVEPLNDKWGSCSQAGDVTLAADLARMDKAFQDYVIVHELLHLRLSTHSKLFKALMTAYVPNWRSLDSDGRGQTCA